MTRTFEEFKNTFILLIGFLIFHASFAIMASAIGFGVAMFVIGLINFLAQFAQMFETLLATDSESVLFASFIIGNIWLCSLAFFTRV
jgi:hypothetical protein